MSEILKFNRLKAAEASGGISNNVIYSMFERILIQIDAKGDILDFGAGAGNLTKRLQKMQRFSAITAADLLGRPPGISEQIEWLNCDLNDKIAAPDKSFDVIISAEVIEHLENPRALMREWSRMLRPGGKLVFSTPNNESWRSLLALLWRGHFVVFGDTCYPAHITALLRKDIERILKETAFSAPKFIFTNVGRFPKFPQLTWQSISFGFLKGLRFSDNLMVISQKPEACE